MSLGILLVLFCFDKMNIVYTSTRSELFSTRRNVILNFLKGCFNIVSAATFMLSLYTKYKKLAC